MTGLAVFCSDRVNFRFRQEQSCPTTADETTPYPTPISENSSANGCSRNFELFSFFRVFIIFFGGGGTCPPTPPPRTPMRTEVASVMQLWYWEINVVILTVIGIAQPKHNPFRLGNFDVAYYSGICDIVVVVFTEGMWYVEITCS